MHSVCQNLVRCKVPDDGLFGPLQGQTGKYFFVVQAGTFALKLPAKQPEHAGDQGAPEQTVSLKVPNTLNPQP